MVLYQLLYNINQPNTNHNFSGHLTKPDNAIY